MNLQQKKGRAETAHATESTPSVKLLLDTVTDAAFVLGELTILSLIMR